MYPEEEFGNSHTSRAVDITIKTIYSNYETDKKHIFNYKKIPAPVSAM